MREVIRITEIAGEGVLVLLDELGAGTDPVSYTHLDVYKRQEYRRGWQPDYYSYCPD